MKNINCLLITKAKKSCVCLFAIVRNKMAVDDAINIFDLNTANLDNNLPTTFKPWI